MNLITERLVPSRLCGAMTEIQQQECDHYKKCMHSQKCLWILGGKCLSQGANDEYENVKKGDAGIYGDP